MTVTMSFESAVPPLPHRETKRQSQKRKKDERKRMLELLRQFRREDTFQLFDDPIDTSIVTDYAETVKHPMDFGIVEQKIDAESYPSLTEFQMDLELICQNCMAYNDEGSECYEEASRLLKIIKRRMHIAIYNVDPEPPTKRRRTKQTKRRKGPKLDKNVSDFLRASNKEVITQAKVEKTKTVPSETAESPQFPYEQIDGYLPVEGADRESVLGKLRTEKRGKCDGNHCSKLENLGPFENELMTFKSECVDRKMLAECSDACGCSSDSCKNRSITLGQGMKLGKDVKKVMTFGIDPYTRLNLIKILPRGLSPDTINSFIDGCFLPAVNEFIPFYKEIEWNPKTVESEMKQKFGSGTTTPPEPDVENSIPMVIQEGEAAVSSHNDAILPVDSKKTEVQKASDLAERPDTVEPKVPPTVTMLEHMHFDAAVHPVNMVTDMHLADLDTVSDSVGPVNMVTNADGHMVTDSNSHMVVDSELLVTKQMDTTANVPSTGEPSMPSQSQSIPTQSSSINNIIMSNSSSSNGVLPTSSNNLTQTSELIPTGVQSNTQKTHFPSSQISVTDDNIKATDSVPSKDNPVSVEIPPTSSPASFGTKEVLLMILQQGSERHDESTLSLAHHMYFKLRRFGPQSLSAEYPVHPKGLGVICCADGGIAANSFIIEYFGEVYPPWRWFEKQDATKVTERRLGIKDKVPDFFNIMLERHKDDSRGFDVVFVDPIRKGNFGSRLSHSCSPNCTSVVMAVDGRYVIAVYALRAIARGEELCFDYNSVTESEEEYRAAVCLCGQASCRGSFLYFAGSTTFQQVMRAHHNFLHRVAMVVRACSESVTDDDRKRVLAAGIKSSVLEGLPSWCVKWVALAIEFIELEKSMLPEALVSQKDDDEVYTPESAALEAHGVAEVRLQNVAITIDRVKHFLIRDSSKSGTSRNTLGNGKATSKNLSNGDSSTNTSANGTSRNTLGNGTVDSNAGTSQSGTPGVEQALAPLRKLSPAEVIERLWDGKNSLVSQLLNSASQHETDAKELEYVRKLSSEKIEATESGLEVLRQKLFQIRDHLRSLTPSSRAYHHAAADAVHLYASTRTFFTDNRFATFKGDPFQLRDLGFDMAGKSSPKEYASQYIWGSLVYWMRQTIEAPNASLSQSRRGSCSLPTVASCYASGSSSIRRPFGRRQREDMIQLIVERPQQYWPTSWHWSFRNGRIYGSPMLDNLLDPNPERYNKFLSGLKEWSPNYPAT
eukprot:941403_1